MSFQLAAVPPHETAKVYSRLMPQVTPSLTPNPQLALPALIITENGPYTSLDPLDREGIQNSLVDRMIYATPVELSDKGTLESRILSSFTYDKKRKLIRWIIKRKVSFSDGTVITTNDIAFAVTRMLFQRPGFHILESIYGGKGGLSSRILWRLFRMG